jgi:amidase
MSELCDKTAVEQRQLIASKQVSAVELLEAHLDQIDEINPAVNAIVTLVPDHARKLAAEVDNKISKGQDPGLLAGLPVAHKDLLPTRGIRTTYGSRLFADFVPTENALIVDRLVDAGAITVGKTNTPEWGAGSQTFNDVFGETRNPYDLARTCGGSSGGAAVALATRMLPIADGSDMGGSLRNPASFCNVVGLRVAAGRVPALPAVTGWSNISVLGPMARTVEDCALLLAAIAGPDDRSPIALPDSGKTFLEPLNSDVADKRIAIAPDFGGQLPVAAEVKSMIEGSSKVFADLGCHADEDCPDFSGADEAFKTLRAWGFAATHGENIRKYPDKYKATIIWNVETGLKLTGTDVSNAEKQRTAVMRRVVEFMSDYDFLVLPVAQVAPFPLTEEYITNIDGVEMDTYIDWMKSCYFISIIGLPAISVPCGFTPEGLPVGLQIVGKPRGELDLLKIAYAFEQQTLNWQKKPQ